jgi:hypothetical protein
MGEADTIFGEIPAYLIEGRPWLNLVFTVAGRTSRLLPLLCAHARGLDELPTNPKSPRGNVLLGEDRSSHRALGSESALWRAVATRGPTWHEDKSTG